jgi:hypothetical protein
MRTSNAFYCQAYMQHIEAKHSELVNVLLIAKKVLLHHSIDLRVSLLHLCAQHLVSFYENCGFSLVGQSDVVHGQEVWYELEYTVGKSKAKAKS